LILLGFDDRMKLAPMMILGLATTGWAAMTPEQVQSLPPPATRRIDFARDVKPLFDASCVKCHARGKAKGGFRFDTREDFLKGGHSGPAAVAGRSAGSYLIELVAGVDPENVMPVKGSRLTAEQVGLLRAWIDQGLAWPAEVTFAKPPPQNLHPRQPTLPPATAASGGHPVDRLLQTYFERHGLEPRSPVDDRLFLRRVFLDVTGLLPSPGELEAFLADTRPDKRERVVDRLLADHARYAQHWLSFWNDLLRNDYRGTGYIDGGRKQISGWLHAALAANKPFDRFVAELVNPTKANEGFIGGIVWRGAVNASQTPQMQAAQNIAQVFMGVNLKCASCHDSFINDWTLADAYGLAGVYADERLEMFHCDKPTGQKAAAKFIYPELGDIPPDAPQSEKRRRLAEILTSPSNGRLTRTVVNRLWARLLGRGLVEPVDDMEQAAWHPDLLDWLAEDLAAHGYDLKRTLRVILTSRAYQMPAVSLDEQPRADFVFAGPTVRRLTAEQFRDALGVVTGVWFDSPAAEFDFTAGPAEQDAQATLLPRPAKWIWSEAGAAQKAPAETVHFWKRVTLEAVPEEAFVVAVADNSFTLHVNGKKALTGNDFSRPNFADVRPLLRPGENVFAVVAANHTPDNQPPKAGVPPREQDANPAGLLLYARVRQAERVLDFVTDASWQAAKARPEGWPQPGAAVADPKPAVELGDADLAPWRSRQKLATAMSVALIHGEVRASLVAADALTTALGRPNREQVNTTRPSAANTLQGLELTNGETLSRVLQRGAEKLLAAQPGPPEELVTRLYARALGRKPTAQELQLAGELLGQPPQKEHVEDLLWSLAMLPEFQLVY
jgi:mono/diheme cytochrome c family protein